MSKNNEAVWKHLADLEKEQGVLRLSYHHQAENVRVLEQRVRELRGEVCVPAPRLGVSCPRCRGTGEAVGPCGQCAGSGRRRDTASAGDGA